MQQPVPEAILESSASVWPTLVAVTTRQPPARHDDAAEIDVVEIELSAAAHRALLKFKYVDPMQLAQLEAATPIGTSGAYVLVKMGCHLAELLAGDLAYVINRAKPTHSILMLNEAAEAIESALR